MRSVAIAALVAASLLLLFRAPSADAQSEVTFLFPLEGDVLAEPPSLIRMCFAEPVNILDLNAGGDFRFSVITPEDRGLGLRIVFQPDGLGVDVFPGLPQDPIDGEWTFEWRVTEPETLEPATGTVRFTVDPEGTPAPVEPARACRDTATPAPDDSDSAASGNDEGDGSDVLLITGIVAGSVALAVAAGVVYLRVRRRPPPAN